MPPDHVALIEVAIKAKSKANFMRLRTILTDLLGRDQSVFASIDSESGQIILKGASESVLDQTIGILQQDYGIGLKIGPVQVAYRETMTCRVVKEFMHTMQIGGKSQSARIKIVFEPVERGAGSSFTLDIASGALLREHIADVEKGINSVMSAGVLAGFPVVDIEATLIDGAYDKAGSPTFAFEIAARAAFREALREGGSILLEPVMKVEITTPEDYLGSITGDLSGRRGQIAGQTISGKNATITAMVPLANLFGYTNQLQSFSQGHAMFEMHFSHYQPASPYSGGTPPPAVAAALRA